MWIGQDPSRIDAALECRTLSFENPTGARGAAGTAGGGRKGAPLAMLEPGQVVSLGDVEGPGTVRHVWMTFPPMPPEEMRAVWMEITWDDCPGPSVSAPCLDFFGLPHGRPAPLSSALLAAQEGRGFNCWIPMPFRRRLQVRLGNGSKRRFPFYYQISYTLGPVPPDAGLLHASFRRENPTRLARDFAIADGLAGPGRFLGCNLGVRVLHDEGFVWYGEGEVKMWIDGDTEHPTWCGTGLEDYVGTAWGMGVHGVPLQGVSLELRDPSAPRPMPDFVSFYRWHLPDPIVFRERLRVSIQQIGALPVPKGRADLRERMEREGRVAGTGWMALGNEVADVYGICERQDDYCATAYVYCREPQPVPRLDLEVALADIERRAYEAPGPLELGLAALQPR